MVCHVVWIQKQKHRHRFTFIKLWYFAQAWCVAQISIYLSKFPVTAIEQRLSSHLSQTQKHEKLHVFMDQKFASFFWTSMHAMLLRMVVSFCMNRSVVGAVLFKSLSHWLTYNTQPANGGIAFKQTKIWKYSTYWPNKQVRRQLIVIMIEPHHWTAGFSETASWSTTGVEKPLVKPWQTLWLSDAGRQFLYNCWPQLVQIQASLGVTLLY